MERHGAIAVFDLTSTPVERYNKLMPYVMFGGVDYAVAILRVGDVIKVSLGTNPWSKSAPLTNLASVAERYGGGGHSAVAGIALGSNELLRARQIVDQIVVQLIESALQAHSGNGHGRRGEFAQRNPDPQ